MVKRFFKFLVSVLLSLFIIGYASIVINTETGNLEVDANLLAQENSAMPKQLTFHVGLNPSESINVAYITGMSTDNTFAIVRSKSSEIEKKFYGEQEKLNKTEYIHTVTLSGLTPNTEYEVVVGENENTAKGTFKTALKANDEKEFDFAYIADPQVDIQGDCEACGIIFDEIYDRNPDFLYIAGDVTNNDKSTEWKMLFNNDGAYRNAGNRMLSNCLTCVTCGNHDTRKSSIFKRFGVPVVFKDNQGVYSYDYGCAKFIVLNMNNDGNETQRVEQYNYLKTKVIEAKANNQWTILCIHQGVYSGGGHINETRELRKFWSPALADLDVDVVLQGHDHLYARGVINGKGEGQQYTKNDDGSITASGNAPLYVVGGHAGALKWYSKEDYNVTDDDPITPDYKFLDVQITTDDNVPDKNMRPMFNMVHVSKNEIELCNYAFEYDSTTNERGATYLSDKVVLKR